MCIRDSSYTIDNGPVADLFHRYYTWHIPVPLDMEAMHEGARLFVGTHDFRAFQSAGGTVKTTVRTLFSLKIEQEKRFIVLTFKGDGFLYKMVRSITCLLYTSPQALSVHELVNSLGKSESS